jgi:hypothetical protein
MIFSKMKLFYIVLCCIFAFTIIVPEVSTAQELSKKERKKIKKEAKQRAKQIKSMKPADFLKEQEEMEAVREKASTLESQVSTLQSSVSSKETEVKKLQDEVRRLENQVQEARTAAEQTKNIPVTTSDQYDEGLVFRVQIGAYRNKDLEKFMTSDTMNEEKGDEGVQKYTLGNFRDYWEADTFKKYLREMGVKDAWIVPYQDGVRVPIKDVLENLQTQRQEQ